jgi:starch synthase
VFIVMVASECAPVAQAGGLGEVVLGLGRELVARGHRVEIILPKYDSMRYGQIQGLTVAHENLWVPWYEGAVPCTIWSGEVLGLHCFFIEPHSWDQFFERGHLYGSPDDLMRFAFFSKAAMEFMLKTERRPEIIHCHDWQTALVPVLLFEMYAQIGMHDQRVCYTIHNFMHQGVTWGGEDILRATGLNRREHFFQPDRLLDDSNPYALNLMKGGIVYSNFVTTVSPEHAWETRFSDQGFGLQHTLHVHQNKFGGVLNGIDYDVWNPEVDKLIPANYSPAALEQKYACKEALRDRFLLRKDFKPILAYVGRLDRQKGVHLIHHAIFHALAHGAQVVVLGTSPDPYINAHFEHLKAYLNDNPDCHLEIDFNVALAHLIYAGADLMVLPSIFEPCGLAQMCALKYGTVPIVRAVGGLVDTVFDRDYSTRPVEDRNGYVFANAENAALEFALDRAIALWYANPTEFRRLMINGMRQDHSWSEPARHYLNIYEYIAVRKPGTETIASGREPASTRSSAASPKHVDASPGFVPTLREDVDGRRART